jgi:uncharacterized protein YfaQ (DUF2300 family)
MPSLSHRRHLRIALAATLAALAPQLQADTLQLAELRDGALRVRELSVDGGEAPMPDATALRAPLGSVWKLFAHAWLLDTQQNEPAYTCSGQHRDEVYCCEPGQQIERDDALLRSCGLYFEPARLQIDAKAWRSYWARQQAPVWLLELDQLRPDTEVRIDELLALLARLPTRQAQQQLLAAAVLQQPAAVFDALGSQLRVKTWSWHRDDNSADRIAGFAGWSADGSPVWAQGEGTSRSVLTRFAPALARALPVQLPAPGEDCVQVRMFARYPIRRVEHADTAQPAAPGALHGRYRVHFQHGSQFEIRSEGELLLDYADSGPRLIARLRGEDYVARVLEREAASEPAAAARALAIVIRSYLQQNASRAGECLSIDDSSARQRVLAQPPGEAARAHAAFSAELVLAGSAVRYHLDQAGPDQLGWRQAQAAAAAGEGVSAILREHFPRADLAPLQQAQARCEALPDAQAWLQAQLPRWRPRLQTEPGYQERSDFEVCQLLSGRPFVDRARRRIHARGLRSQQDRLDLTHEYLHLGFEAHPHGEDESFIEDWTRRLLLE